MKKAVKTPTHADRAEILNRGYYIDDNSLYVFIVISLGLLSNTKYAFDFTYHTPHEWEHKDMLKFLLSISKEYNFELENFDVNISAVRDEYEVSVFDEDGKPKKGYEKEAKEYAEKTKEYVLFDQKVKMPPSFFDGAYEWALDKSRKQPQAEFSKLFQKFHENKITARDIKEAFKYAEPLLNLAEVSEAEKAKEALSKKIFSDLLDWTTFNIKYTEPEIKKLKQDLNSYINKFINNELRRNPFTKRIKNTYVGMSENIFRFEKQKEMLMFRLKWLEKDFGRNFEIKNDKFQIIFDSEEDIRLKYKNRQFLFIHILFALFKQGYFKLEFLGSNWTFYEDEPVVYKARVELRDKFFEEIKTPKIPEIKKMPEIKQEETGCRFDPEKSKLFVRDKTIKIQKFSDQYHALKIMFGNADELTEEWFFSKMAERYEPANPPQDKKFYNAIYQINQKLKAKGIDDFFITTRQSVKINGKYLS